MKFRNASLFIFLLLITLGSYYVTRHAGFMGDFFLWQQRFSQYSWTAFVNSFHLFVMQQVTSLALYFMYRLFDLSGWWWYVTFCLLHALNGLLLFRFYEKLLSKLQVSRTFLICLSGTLLFLLSPYNTEVVVYRACLQYLLSTLFILINFHLVLSYMESPQRKYAWISNIIFVIALFTFELAFITPLLLAVLILMMHRSYSVTPNGILKRFVYPPLLILPLHFAVSKLTLGTFIGHYGIKVHTHFVLGEVVPAYFKYFLKYLLFFRYWDFHKQETLYGIVDHKYFFLPLFIISLGILTCVFIFYGKLSARFKLSVMSLLFFFISLTPIINLYFSFLLQIENDRYGYLPAMFYWFFIAILLSRLPRWLYFLLSGSLIFASVLFVVRTTNWWKEQGEVFTSLASDFRWYNKKEVVILNVPDNYHGINMYRIYNAPSGFIEALEFYRKQKFTATMYEVSQYNMMTPDDGVSVKVDSANALTVTFNQWGNWWWRSGLGASDYENDRIAVDFEGNLYHLRFKKLDPDHAIIYQQGKHWEELKM